MNNSKDSLISLSSNQVSPYNAKPSDWSVKVPAEGSMSGKDKLVNLPEDNNAVMPSDFSVAKNSGETGTSVKCGWGVSFDSGSVTPNVADSY
jgi:hypothetical protein